MASPNQLSQTIQSEVDKFNSSIPKIQKQILSEIEILIKGLDVKNGSLKVNTRNLRIVGSIKSKIESLILKNRDYKDRLKTFIKAFDVITIEQNKYFESLSDEYTPPKLLKEIRVQAKDATYESLTKAGIGQNLSRPIQEIIKTNITTGAKYTDMVTQLRDYITNNKSGEGKLEKYSKQITTDALNQYAAQYSDIVTNDLGLEWFQYVGALIETSRPFCVALHKKRYINRSEIPAIIEGDFPEFKEADGTLNKNGQPQGMIPNTNPENFKVYRGGFNCGHQLTPVSELAVPKDKRDFIGIDGNADSLIQKAKDSESELDKIMQDLSEKNELGRTDVNLKSKDSIIRKAKDELSNDVTEVKDSIRGSLFTDDSESLRQSAEQLKGVADKFKYQDTDLGYTGYLANIKMENGIYGEVQLNTPKMIYAKEVNAKGLLGDKLFNEIKNEIGLPHGLGHKYYEEYRVIVKSDAPKDKIRAAEIMKESTEYYSKFR